MRIELPNKKTFIIGSLYADTIIESIYMNSNQFESITLYYDSCQTGITGITGIQIN